MDLKKSNMYKRPALIVSFFLIILAGTLSCTQSDKKTSSATGPEIKALKVNVKPFRVLVIIGDQWTDPMSYNIDPTRVKDEDFLDVVTMLKIWGVPLIFSGWMNRGFR